LIGKAGFSYPSAARRAGREGLVMVAFIVSEKGRVSAPQVVDSSGHKDLDAAALRAVAGWKFRPARLSDGTTVEHRIRVPIDFRLR